ncbi:ABC transporter permease [Phytoactinopolyspora alkaliphila]|uniref:ABC transporter permease n=1 Tax=Phytoactinopolyspora alkaliphila TaxID=1783498 RepID=A0A6N9YNH1_9ACTN|nr:ABC transporter permease [Phytoactinopolyspora alkaliphila]NED96497.1 ABC transporter permease [Phytoactinopolyspora alkaliphila]
MTAITPQPPTPPVVPPKASRRGQSQRMFWREFARHTAARWSLAIIALFVFAALAADVLPLQDPTAISSEAYTGPSGEHWFGTDHLGRDMFSRTVHGARVAIIVALGSAGLATAIGIVVGAIAGYTGGRLDDLLSRTADVFLLIPVFFLVVLIVALFGQGLFFVVLIIGLTTWPQSARLMRAEAMVLRERVFVVAARASGGRGMQVLFRHVIPNGLSPVITNATILMGQAILVEAGLSFLGLGDPQVMSWGRMIFDGRGYLDLSPWMSFFPGLAMFLLVLSLNLVGDGLTQAFNPKLRRRGRA